MGNLKTAPGPHAVHMCIDMQRLFAPGGPWAAPWMERILPTIAALVEHAPARTLFTRFIPPNSTREAEGMWRRYYEKWASVTREQLPPSLLDLVVELQPHVPPAAIFDRHVYSVFSDGRLHPLLRSKQVDTLIMTGSETDVCVLASVLGAVDLGYRVIVVEDALCSSSDETHDALMTLYARRFDIQIELADAAEMMELWRPDAG